MHKFVRTREITKTFEISMVHPEKKEYKRLYRLRFFQSSIHAPSNERLLAASRQKIRKFPFLTTKLRSSISFAVAKHKLPENLFFFVRVKRHQIEAVHIFGEFQIVQRVFQEFDLLVVFGLVNQVLDEDTHILTADLRQ